MEGNEVILTGALVGFAVVFPGAFEGFGFLATDASVGLAFGVTGAFIGLAVFSTIVVFVGLAVVTTGALDGAVLLLLAFHRIIHGRHLSARKGLPFQNFRRHLSQFTASTVVNENKKSSHAVNNVTELIRQK